MKTLKFLLILIFTTGLSLVETAAQVMSFEQTAVPADFSIDKGRLFISTEKYKLGKQSLGISWKSGAVLEINAAESLSSASAGKNGGINAWIYNDTPVNDYLTFSFRDRSGSEVCRLPFKMNFRGWRCIWAKFQADMGMPQGTEITSACLMFPETAKKGKTYVDMLEFTKTVSWQNMSDAQYNVSRTDFSLIPDFNGYRNAEKKVENPIKASDAQIKTICDRLESWYLGSANVPQDRLSLLRYENEREFIRSGLEKAGKYEIGSPLFPLGAPDKVNGEKCVKFKELNENVLIPLALDYRKNGNVGSLNKILDIYDWFNDQGWADGSGMGTLTFERLRSSGYFHSFFLVKDRLSEEKLERELNTLDWFSLFGICFTEQECKGEVADNLRGLAIAKLIYALSLTDLEARQTALTAFKNYMDNALGLAPGYFGTFKPDYSGYHHRGAYHSAYYPHALYAGAFIAYLLHDTPYELSEETLANIRNGLLNFRFFCAGLDVPAGTTGRFPNSQTVLHTLLPAFAYAAFCKDTPDPELTSAFRTIIADPSNTAAIEEYVSTVKSSLAYTSTMGEIEAVNRLMAICMDEKPETVRGARFYPYSGLLVSKDGNTQFNIKGYSRYIWDFESSDTENIHGRYISYGHIEFFDFRNGLKSFNPAKPGWNWNYMPGATTRILPYDLLQDKGGADSGHRNFSDQTFLAGVAVSDSLSMFSVRLHDIAYDTTFHANKSVFIFKNWLFCMGSDISSKDPEHNIATTLFQSFGNNVKNGDGENVLEDGSFLYAVRNGKTVVRTDKECTRAFIDHGILPERETYEYFIVRDKNSRTAATLLSENSPVTVISNNDDAHIIMNTEGRDTVFCGALFNTAKKYDNTPVVSSNIPLAYIYKKDESGKKALLQICEPDMRRPYKAHMGLLTEKEVITEELPFLTSVTLRGNLAVKGKDCESEYFPETDTTVLRFTTIRGENYTFEIEKAE